MSNSAYGKAMENVRKRVQNRLVDNAKYCNKYVSRPSFFHRRYLVNIV